MVGEVDQIDRTAAPLARELGYFAARDKSVIECLLPHLRRYDWIPRD